MGSSLSIKWKLILAVVGVTTLSLVGMFYYHRHQTGTMLVDRGKELAAQLADLEAAKYSARFLTAITAPQAVVSRVFTEFSLAHSKVRATDMGRIDWFARTVTQTSPYPVTGIWLSLDSDKIPSSSIVETGIYNSSGRLFISYEKRGAEPVRLDPPPEEELARMPWWNHLNSDRVELTDPYFKTDADNRKQLSLTYSIPIMYDGARVGRVGCDVSFARLHSELDSSASELAVSDYHLMAVSNKGIVAMVADRDVDKIRDFLSPSDTPEIIRINETMLPEIVRAIRESRSAAETVFSPHLNDTVYVVNAPIENESIDDKWSIVFFYPRRSALSQFRDTIWEQFRTSLVIFVVSVFLGLLVANLVGKTLIANERWHQAILDRVPLPLGIIDERSRWSYVNDAMAAFLGASRSALSGEACGGSSSMVNMEFMAEANRRRSMEPAIREVERSGSYYSLVTHALIDSSQQYLGRLVVGVDITNARLVAFTLRQASAIAASLDEKAERITDAAESLSHGAMDQSAAIEEITATTQRIGETSAENAAAAQNSRSIAEQATGSADKGAAEAENVNQAMNGVKESGRKVTSIIKLIDDIAFQTNLLSLNAAVEAARAGKNGKGFAVVADEVRNLAGRSAKAAHESEEIIREMTARIEGAAESMRMLEDTLQAIKNHVQSLTGNFGLVANSASEQSQAVRQVHFSLEQINQGVAASIAISKETAVAAEALAEQAVDLRRLTRDKTADSPSRTAASPPSFPGMERGADWRSGPTRRLEDKSGQGRRGEGE